MDANDHPIEVRILGPVEAFRGGAALSLGGRRQRALLALLVTAAGNTVATEIHTFTDRTFEAARMTGRGLSLADAVERAIEEGATSPSTGP